MEEDTDRGSTIVLSTRYNITELDEDSRYIFTVNATETDATASNAVSTPIAASTKQTGMNINVVI